MFACNIDNCGRTFSSMRGVRMHITRSHRKGKGKRGRRKGAAAKAPSSCTLREAISILKVKRDAMNETISILEELDV